MIKIKKPKIVCFESYPEDKYYIYDFISRLPNLFIGYYEVNCHTKI